ncbi:ricin B lectin domain-containing protein [Aspergillus bertholletiae]|uniref:Ricin B lectin domain-containing protein n=1 Tax=Aspergillus bertholletiae TaxID=1226010 RepID=A0A5N7ANV2_9EURO|nr:ricin B lectin domain-containing protein [Aspergillus bertholletiae]
MSDFTGPNVYTVVARHVDKRLDLDSGNKADGTKLQLYKPLDDATYGPNQRFVFAHVGNDEYLIINAKSGTYLTASDDSKQITANLLPPLEKRIRWKIEPVKDRSGAYYIQSVAFPNKVIDISGAKADDKTAALTYTKNNKHHQQFFLRSGAY